MRQADGKADKRPKWEACRRQKEANRHCVLKMFLDYSDCNAG